MESGPSPEEQPRTAEPRSLLPSSRSPRSARLGASQGSRHRPGQAQGRAQGPAGRSGDLRAPRAGAWECGQRGVTGGGAGRRGPGEGRGTGGGKRTGPPVSDAQGPHPTPSRTPSAPSNCGLRHPGRAVPLPSPGSAALPAPRTPSF